MFFSMAAVANVPGYIPTFLQERNMLSIDGIAQEPTRLAGATP